LHSLGSMGSTTISNIMATPSAVALLTLTSALALSFTLRKSKSNRIMPSAKAAAVSDPKLPSHFVVGSFQNSRSQSLFTINLPPKDSSPSPPKALAFIVHGISEHCCRAGYVGLFESLSEAGVDVYGIDHHGHGRSEGEPRGYVENFDHYVGDLLDYIKYCQKKYIEKDYRSPKVVLIGQSMGALIAVQAVRRLGSYHIGGIVLTSPALGVDMNLELKVQKAFAPMIDKLMPKARIVDAVRPEDMSRNPEAVKAYINDPLCMKGKLVAHTAIEMSKTFQIVKQRRGEVTCPILMMHGTDDRCTSINASREFFHHVGTPLAKKRFLQLPGMYHELLEEPEVDQLMVSIVEFASSGGEQFATIEGKEDDGLINVTL